MNSSTGHIPAHYPPTPRGYFMRAFWSVYTPVHPRVRDIALALRVVDQSQFLDGKGRQLYVLGTIAPGSSVEKIVARLRERGYGNNFVAWHDSGEIASLRILDGFDYQYHVRIFSDNEVRAHYEMTPEMHPWKHYYEINMEPRTAYFLELLESLITPV